MMKAVRMFKYTRPWSFPMTVLSLSMGLATAIIDGASPPYFVSLGVIIGGLLFHASANLWNDYFDYVRRVDVPGAPTTRYREHPIVAGGVSEKLIAIFALSLSIAGLALGIVAFLILGNPWVPLFCALGAFAAYSYTGPPIEAKYRSLGEPMVFMVWGLLFPLAAYVTVAGTFDAAASLSAVPFGLLVAAVLTANNARDIDYDAARGVKTLCTLLGRKQSVRLLQAEVLGAYILQSMFVMMGVYPLLAALPLASLPLALRVLRVFSIAIPDNADPLIANIALAFGVLHVAGLALDLVIHRF